MYIFYKPNQEVFIGVNLVKNYTTLRNKFKTQISPKQTRRTAVM